MSFISSRFLFSLLFCKVFTSHVTVRPVLLAVLRDLSGQPGNAVVLLKATLNVKTDKKVQLVEYIYIKTW